METYEEYRKHFYDNISDEVKKDLNSLYSLDIEQELERLCRQEYDTSVAQKASAIG